MNADISTIESIPDPESLSNAVAEAELRLKHLRRLLKVARDIRRDGIGPRCSSSVEADASPAMQAGGAHA